ESQPIVEIAEGPREKELVAALRGLDKSYGRRTVLAGLNATFESSTLTVVTGPSGSGKTTLLHVLGGLELPDGGLVTVLGENVSRLDRAGRADFRRDHIGYLGPQARLLPALSAL